ncbi:unnamed protein product, partial [Polarella glacialis]
MWRACQLAARSGRPSCRRLHLHSSASLETTAPVISSSSSSSSKARRLQAPVFARHCSAAPAAASSEEGSSLPPLVDQSLRGFGQVVFCNSPASGALIGLGLLHGNPWLAGLAGVGCVSATVTARLAGMEAGSIGAGIMGYNGALVGCCFSVFLLGGAPMIEPAILATAAGGAASAFVTAALGKVLTSVPQWTLAFNATALAVLLFVRPFADTEQEVPPSTAVSALSAADWGTALLTGVSQIFLVNDPFSGALVLAGIAAYSPLMAAAALAGSLLGLGTAVATGADAAEVRNGLWGFNPALTCLAVSVFFVPLGISPLVLACGGAVATALLTAYMKDIFGSVLQVPSLTLPFCAVASACYLLASRSPSGAFGG